MTAARLASERSPARLHWIRAPVGPAVRLIATGNVDYLQSDTKSTRVAWREQDGTPGDALVRTPLRELLAQLDPDRFVQIHRSVVVNLAAVSRVERADNETARLHLRGRPEVLPVSRSFVHHFRQM